MTSRTTLWAVAALALAAATARPAQIREGTPSVVVLP